MHFLSSRRALNIAIAAVAVAVIALAGVLGYAVWSQNRSIEQSTPVSREVRALAQQVRKNPKDIDTRMKLAQALTVGGRYGEAIEQYNAVLDLRKDFAPALSGLGFIAAREKEWSKSEDYWRKVISISSKAPTAQLDKGLETAHYYLATSLYEQERYEEAASEFKEALRMNPTASDTHYLLAMTWKQLGSKEAYRESMENALTLDPMMPEANYEMGLILKESGDLAGAAEHFRIAADKAPGVAAPREALDDLGPASERVDQARAKLGSDPKAARDQARIAVAVDPRSVDGWVVLGAAYAKLDKKKDAASAYRKALELDPQNSEATQGLKQVDNADS